MTTNDVTQSQEIRISAYIDEELDQAAREAFEKEMANNDALADEVHELQSALSALSTMSAPMPSEDFLKKVEDKINHRSHGRFFDPSEANIRIPYEVFAAVMIIILAAVYFYDSPSNTANDTHMAMSGPKTPQTTPDPQPTPEVVPLRHEIIQYSLTLDAHGPLDVQTQKIKTQIESTSLEFKVRVTRPGRLSVRLPATQVNDFLQAFGRTGKVRRTRVYIQGQPKDDKVNVDIRLKPKGSTP